VVGTRLGLLVGALALAGCTRAVDPCGAGMYRVEDRCMSYSPDAAKLPARVGALPEPDFADASLDASDQDAEPQDAQLRDAQPQDASSDATASSDAPVDAAEPQTCYPQDRSRWQEFHLSAQLASAIFGCAWPPICSTRSCPNEQCLRVQVGVTSCSDCVAAETECILSECRRECGIASTSDSCRACLCSNGCLARFDQCARTNSDAICNGCTEMTCIVAPDPPPALPPELIMVVIDGLL
jgi:hypothetical protein